MKKYNFGEDESYLLEQNLLGIDNSDDLELAEQFAFTVRSLEMECGKYTIDSFNLASLMALHHYLFQDIYRFAGKIRKVQLIKGDTRFCQMQYILSMCDQVFTELAQEGEWPTVEIAAQRLAYYKSELNIIHPFREGNGRVIRLFIYAYAKSKGYNWDFVKLERDGYMQAMIDAVLDTNKLENIFLHTLAKGDSPPL